LNIAVFIDFDNIEIGVKNTLGQQFDVGTILDAIKERGEVVTKIAYADWTRAGEYSRHLTQHAIRLVQRNLTPGGDKNGADINLALDALEMAFTHDHINAFAIVSGDSDFIALVNKLKQYNKMIFVVGGRAFTSTILQKNCHEFISYESLLDEPQRAPRVQHQQHQPHSAPQQQSNQGHRGPNRRPAPLDLALSMPLVERALQVLERREVRPQLGLLKSTMLQLDSTFNEKAYGSGSFARIRPSRRKPRPSPKRPSRFFATFWNRTASRWKRAAPRRPWPSGSGPNSPPSTGRDMDSRSSANF
jgi:uncharacterized protein (TIGR00288 family)